MTLETQDLLEQLDSHLRSPNVAWLLGAGICKEAGIPLMYPLTARVLEKLGTEHKEVLEAIKDELPNTAHIEQLLSQLGDYITLANRSENPTTTINEIEFHIDTLTAAHEKVLKRIAETVRWGFVPVDGGADIEGTADAPIVRVDEHRDFIEALFEVSRAGLEQRGTPVRLFTTNYDTLLEDALALNSVQYWDGFSRGAVAYRVYSFGQEFPLDYRAPDYRAYVVKLHGSIDWTQDKDGKVLRIRDQDTYPDRTRPVLIHPQVTKYMATQRDPFAAQFDLFRRTLTSGDVNVLAICGYGFGDEHINEEIELAMERRENQMTMLAFCSGGDNLPECVGKWRSTSWADRMYLVTGKGLYVGDQGPINPPAASQTRDWWTFSGVTNLLKNGAVESS